MESITAGQNRGLAFWRAATCMVVACLLPAAIANGQQARMAVKQLTAPASDIVDGTVRLPAPARTPTLSRAAVLRGEFIAAVDGNGSVARFEFAHGGGSVRLLAVGSDSVRWSGVLRVDQAVVSLSGTCDGMPRVTELFGSQAMLGFEEPARGAELELPAGSVEVEFRASVAPGTPAVLVVDDESSDALAVCLATRVQRAGEPLSLVVRGRAQHEFLAPSVDPRAGSPRACTVDRATVRWSDGTTAQAVIRPRFTDRADEGWSVDFPTARAGDATIWIDGSVRGDDGSLRRRTVLYATRVVDGARIAGTPSVERVPSGPIQLSVPVRGGAANEVLFAAAELWAVTSRSARPLCWVGGLTELSEDVARIALAPGAIALADGEWLECRQLRMHERDGFAPLDLVDRINVVIGPEAARAAAEANHHDSDAPPWCGLPGVASVPIPESTNFVPPIGSHALVLAHGYCADANTWPLTAFNPDAWRYEVLDTNMSNDAFAVDLAVKAAQFKSYGVVAHSQGGCAALHLYAHYWSGLDWAGPGRLIQTVGTPFEGTALAGNIAALGEIFGVQCGANYDMTYDGAAAWLSTIPTAARSRVYTHTTTFTNHPFQYDYCNILADVLLSDPEDGVVEDWSGHIPGAVSMGLKTGWCHVSGMRDPDQTLDGQRNATMNAQGAR